MLRRKALDYFSGKSDGGLNCAQSIIAAVNPDNASNITLLEKFANYGGGSAPRGWCGPAYAALVLLGKEKLIKRRYTESAGSVKCAEIRKKGKMPCEGCVKLGAKIIEENTKSKNQVE